MTKGSFYERLAGHGHEIVSDDDYAHLYAQRTGRPSIPPSVMIRAMLCATHDRTSDAETARRTRVDADWKAAMGTDDDFAGIGATTFSLFRARMVITDADAKLFEKTLEKAVAKGILKGKLTAIIDSSPVHGAGVVADTYELVRGFLRKLLRAARGRLDQGVAARLGPLCERKADVDWQDPAARRVVLGELVDAARELRAAVAGIDDPAVVELAGLPDQVVDRDVEEDVDGAPAIRQGGAKDRIVSHSDPEMRHGRKSSSRRFDGHKLDVMTDEGSELILGVDVRDGNDGDGDGAAPMVAQAQQVDGVDLGKLLGDMAYCDGDVREAVQAEGVELVAKVPPVSNGGRYPKTDFAIDLDEPSVTCPAGQTTADARPARDHKRREALRFTFDPDTCAACPLRARCVKGSGPRSVIVGRHERRIAAARAAQAEPATKALLRRRPKVERKIAHLQRLGMRQARYRGKRKTRLQALLAATVANFSRLGVLGVFDNAAGAAQAA